MGKKFVFVDWNIIDPGYGVCEKGYYPENGVPYGIEIVAHKPIIEKEPVIKKDKPWEASRVGAFATVIKIDDTYHCWYDAIGPRIHHCYATSKDGITWEKPNLGLVEFNGNKDNNLIFDNGTPNIVDEGWTVIYQENAPENEKFKMAFTRVTYYEDGSHDVYIYGATSADGLRWSTPVKFFRGGDCQTSFYYDEITKKYRIFTKAQDRENLARRTIIYAESTDFKTWSEPRYILHGSPLDSPCIDYYCAGYHPWKGTSDAHILLLPTYHRNIDKVFIDMAVSRDLYTFNKVYENMLTDYDGGATNYPDIGMTVDEKGRWVHYFCTLEGGHNGSRSVPVEKRPGGIRRMIFRPDGYTSLYAKAHGEFTTVAIKLGGALKINADIPYMGYIKIAVTDFKTNQPVEGFDFDDCTLTPVDDYHYEVTWKKPLSSLGDGYRLRVKMFRSHLYSFTVDANGEIDGDLCYVI